jgi:hypothetical protein
MAMAEETGISSTFNPLDHGGVLVPGFPAYSVTPDGRVWSKYIRGGKGRRSLGVVWHEKIPSMGLLGHLRVELYDAKSKKRILVHRLVLECFVGKCPRGMEACHNNGNALDNRVENLRWDTRESNWNDKRMHGTATVGSVQSQAKLTEQSVIELRILRSNGWKLKDLSLRYGVSVAKVSQVARGESWRHVDG